MRTYDIMGPKGTPSLELQARLDIMKGWTAKRLAAAVPNWAKPRFLPPTFKPQLSQKLPNLLTRHIDPHPNKLFLYMPEDLHSYVEEWEDKCYLKPSSPLTRQSRRLAA
jgi:hypothetical protein